ncbi:MAG TPA: hypothetical protein VLE49_21170 [Anaerolineales bacterium]|nr:hypothetical protein [Anaerolineales bacterium]
MNPDIAGNDVENRAAERVTQRTVFWAAVFSTCLGILYLIGLVGKLIVDGTVHSVSSQPVQIVSAITAILLDLNLLILFVALRRQISGKNMIFADLAVVFMTLVCATSSVSWFVQLAVLPKIVQAGDTTMAAWVDIHNNGSIMYAIEHLGWGIFYGLATIFLAMAMGAGKLDSWIRWLLVTGGILSILHVPGIITTHPAIGDLGYLAWGVLLPSTTTLLAIRFARK